MAAERGTAGANRTEYHAGKTVPEGPLIPTLSRRREKQ